jgi:tetratricopeptide (TPR) repeat protein
MTCWALSIWQIAVARARQGNVEGAEQAFKDGLVLLSGDQRLILGLAGLYTGQGDLDGAASTFEQGIKADPENARFTLGLAGVRERQKRYEDAIAIYEQAHEKNPDNLIVVNNLASLLSDHRDDEQSLARAKELAGKLAETNQPALLDTLGWVHYRLGEYDQAAEVLSGVVEKAPDVPQRRRSCPRLLLKNIPMAG